MLADFDQDTRDAAKKSPTLKAQLAELEGRNPQVPIVKGPAGGGSYYDGNQVVIDANERGPRTTGTIAHEVGHATYQAEPATPMSAGREAYIKDNTDRYMRDEGNAQFNAAKVRSEVKGNGGQDTGIPGAHQDRYQDSYDRYQQNKISEAEAKQEMTKTMASERTSTTNEPYEDYYGDHYAKQYDNANGGPP